MPRGKGQVKIGDKCIDCGHVLTIMNAAYHLHYLRPRCYSCYRLKYNAWVRENRKRPEVIQAHKEDGRQRYYKTVYGITEEQYNEMVEFQQGGCAICRQKCDTHDRLSVDHDHITGLPRALLCQKCNTAIGMFREDEDLMWNALEYLKKHKRHVS